MKAYFFDIDGTLLDSIPLLVRSVGKQLTDCGLTPPPTDELLATIIPIGYLNTAKYLVELGVPKTAEEVLENLYRDVAEGYLTTVPTKPHAKEMLAHLASQGAELYILSAGAPAVVEPTMKRLGIFDYFKELLFTDSLGFTKREPAIYHAAAARVGMDITNCVFVDDNAENIAAAHKAGMHTVGMYDEGSSYGWADMQRYADRTIRDFAELME